MGKGIDLGREQSPALAQALDDLKDQMLIVLVKRLGGKVVLPVAEVDDTSGDLLDFRIDENRNFIFEARKKS